MARKIRKPDADGMTIDEKYAPTWVGTLERAMRIELTPSVWKTEALPLSYARVRSGQARAPHQPTGSWRAGARDIRVTAVWGVAPNVKATA